MTLQGKTALVTGGSSGIGLAAAKMLRENAARVAITGRSAEKLQAAKAELGNDILAIQADVSSLADLHRMKTILAEEFSTLDILFANAGVAIGTPLATVDVVPSV